MPKKNIEQVEEQVEVKKGFVAYAAFEFRGRQYKEGEVFQPPHDLYPDPNLDEFRRVNTKKNIARGRTFYSEIPSKDLDGDPEIRRIVLPVE